MNTSHTRNIKVGTRTITVLRSFPMSQAQEPADHKMKEKLCGTIVLILTLSALGRRTVLELKDLSPR